MLGVHHMKYRALRILQVVPEGSFTGAFGFGFGFVAVAVADGRFETRSSTATASRPQKRSLWP